MRVIARAGLLTGVASALVKSSRKMSVRGGSARELQRPGWQGAGFVPSHESKFDAYDWSMARRLTPVTGSE